ncbi:MAG: hypothetical protein HY281_10960 [Nitrospirae bacterium]|nr:hypothetical protein [Nitrospirota bacterium]
MGWIADLLKEIPSAARYKAELEAIEKENAVLKAQVSDLKQELQRRDHGQRLEEIREKMLVLLIEDSWVPDSAVAKSLNIKVPLASYHLNELLDSGFIESCLPGIITKEPNRRISQSGRSYLVSRGLL